jgi:hypothetical protein
MQNAIGLPEPALVSPETFLDRMIHIWSQPPFNMPTSPALLGGWRVLADHFHGVILGNLSETQVKLSFGETQVRPSFVLPLPTGAGKTEGTCVYAALQAEKNAGHPNPIGVLIVTRLIADADKVVNKINTIAGRKVAVAHHSENKLAGSVMAQHDVLVITHQAFMNAAQTFANHEMERWNTLHSWYRGVRSLIIVDEALANAVDHNKITSEDLEVVLRAVPYQLRDQHPSAIRSIELLKAFLDKKERTQAPGAEQVSLCWGVGAPKLVEEMNALRDALRSVDFDPTLYSEDAAQTVDDILEDLEAMFDSHAYYYRQGAQHSLNCSRYLLYDGMPGVVILDATAHCNLLHALLESTAYVVVPVPSRIRDYGNVTLHVARTSAGLGKTTMNDTKHLRLPRLAKELAEQIAPGRSVFLCVHKLAKDLAVTFSTEALPLKVAWWGAVDGRNDWADCDVAVIFGLPYMEPRRAINNVFATRGPRDDAWLQAPPVLRGNINVLDVMIQRDVSASVVQAINRICCRKMIDVEGRCEKADVYIALPQDWRGDAILDDIRMNMPTIHVTPWDFQPDGPKVYAPRSKSAAEAVIGFIRDRKPGAVLLSHIKRELSLSDKQLARLKEDLANATSNITVALRELGVIYKVEGRGRGAKSYLVKAA